MINVLVCDDHEIVREGLRAIIDWQSDMAVRAEAASGAAAIESAAQQCPDVALVDLRLPDMSGIEVCRGLLRVCAEARVVILTSYPDATSVQEAADAGAAAFLIKRISRSALTTVIRRVAAGERFLDPEAASRVSAELVKNEDDLLGRLTPQERRVALLMAEGRSDREIAAEVGISEKTARNYASHVLEKFDVRTRAALPARLQGRQLPPA